jgi:hypothetical protein
LDDFVGTNVQDFSDLRKWVRCRPAAAACRGVGAFLLFKIKGYICNVLNIDKSFCIFPNPHAASLFGLFYS